MFNSLLHFSVYRNEPSEQCTLLSRMHQSTRFEIKTTLLHDTVQIQIEIFMHNITPENTQHSKNVSGNRGRVHIKRKVKLKNKNLNSNKFLFTKYRVLIS